MSTQDRFRFVPSLASTLACAFLAASALAAFTADVAPRWRFDPGTEFGGWESFTQAVDGDNLPDHPASTTGAALVQTVPGATITGSGNLYHQFAAARFEVRDAVDCDLVEVWLQVSTWGTVLDPNSATLEYTDCDGALTTAPAPTVTVLAHYPNPQGLGTNEELLFQWDLASIAVGVRDYTLSFEAAAAHLSLDALLLDVRTDCASSDGCDLGTAYCFGDGSATTCPCGNTGGPGRGCANSFELQGAQLFAWGSTSLAAGNLVLSANGAVPGQAGLFFQGDAAVAGGQGMPFGDGLRCAGSGVVRLQTVVPDAAGEAETSVDVGLKGGAAPDETKFYQFWYRDPVNGPCGGGFNLTNGLELIWTN